jgi:hypothetical protein
VQSKESSDAENPGKKLKPEKQKSSPNADMKKKIFDNDMNQTEVSHSYLKVSPEPKK